MSKNTVLMNPKRLFIISIMLCSSAFNLAAAQSSSTLSAVPKSSQTQLVVHDLQCGEVFNCPPELHRRIDFWIQVFRLWKLNDRIFHDSRVPERVYSVINTEDPCRRRKPRGQVKLEYQRIKQQLSTLADKLEQGADPATLSDLPLANLFSELTVTELRDAADNVRCQSGNRERFKTALENFDRYRGFIVQTLLEQNLSTDIQYLPFVESAFNPRAYSHAGAAGLWQIMPSTARSLGLQVGSSVDERFEPQLASLAAAKYFRRSTDKLTKAANGIGASVAPNDLNPFIVTSYNYGIRGMERAIAQVGTDYMTLLAEYKSNSFRTAVRNFYASFLAARYVAQNAALYFPEVTSKAEPLTDGIVIKKAVQMRQVEKILRTKRKTLRALNPALTSRVWKGTRPVPAGYVLKVPQKSAGWLAQAKRIDKLPVLAGGDSGQRHRVRSGQTACGIANRYKVKCRDLIVLNKLNRKAVIRIGQRLKIPTTGREKYRVSGLSKKTQTLSARAAKTFSSSSIAAANETSNGVSGTQAKSRARSVAIKTQPTGEARIFYPLSLQRKGGYDTLRVLSSETLGHYADWVGRGSSADIRRLNSLKQSSRLIFGRAIKLPAMSEQERLAFETQRANFHEAIAAQYFQRFNVEKTYRHKIRKGETLWRIARNAGIPLWLLHNYNPTIRHAIAGTKVTVPEVKKSS